MMTRPTLILAAAMAFTLFAGCTSGPRQEPAQTSSQTQDGKDSKLHPNRPTQRARTSGPHQGN